MNILFVHERFIFRYGVDRVLIALGHEFVKLGHKVAFLGFTFDPEEEAYPGAVYRIPYDQKIDNYLDLDKIALDWLENNWISISKRFVPDAIINGGWPFYSSIQFWNGLHIPVVFSEHGVVPQKNLSHAEKEINELIHNLRDQFIPNCQLVVPVSNYLGCEMRSKDYMVNIQTIHNGVTDGFMTNTNSLQEARSKTGDPHRVMILGRWEPQNYKNSGVALTIAEKLVSFHVDFQMVLLADPTDITCDPELKKHMLFARHPDDGELTNLMRTSTMGISTSLWEGFNLPIAEMQSLGRPVLAFNVAAHPEVIMHPWFLCEDLDEMCQKTKILLENNNIATEIYTSQNLSLYQKQHDWHYIVKRYNSVLNSVVRDAKRNKRTTITKKSASFKPQVDDYFSALVVHDVSNSCKDPANSGVIRVTRKLGRALQQYTDPIFVIFDDVLKTYVLPTKDELEKLSAFNGPNMRFPTIISPSHEDRIPVDRVEKFKKSPHKFLLMSETTLASRFKAIREFAEDFKIQTVSIFHDAIPITHPELVLDAITRENHGKYMDNIAKNNFIFPNSDTSHKELIRYWEKNKIDSNAIVKSILLPGDFIKKNTNRVRRRDKSILCVSTLEPRKNHRVLLHAFSQVLKHHPDWKLILVGNRYAGAEELAREVETYCHTYQQIEWKGIVSDDELSELYETCSFSVYPSIVEGFGMPIIESMYFDRVCICANTGVMAELAQEGGCLTTDIQNPNALAGTIQKLIENADLRNKMEKEAGHRRIKTWLEYTRELISNLKTDTLFDCPTPQQDPVNSFVVTRPSLVHFPSLQELLYQDLDVETWQTCDSEKIGLVGVLSRMKPALSIKFGTQTAGLLSLLKQFSKHVCLVENCEDTLNTYSDLGDEVTYIKGTVQNTFPPLLEEISKNNISLGLMLIEGNFPYDYIVDILETTLHYKPVSPLCIMCYNSMNPGVKQAIRDVDWKQSPYVSSIDLDFIHGSPENVTDGHDRLSGGFALIYLSPNKREGELAIQ